MRDNLYPESISRVASASADGTDRVSEVTSMARADMKDPDLRASDAERDAVARELGQHFQDGRLDKAEFDERVTAAMAAKTERDLDQVLTDLPPTPAGEPCWAASGTGPDGAPAPAPRRSPPQPASGRPRVLTLIPLLVAAIVISSLVSGGWHHGWPLAPFGFLWLIVPILACGTWIRRGRRRQWR